MFTFNDRKMTRPHGVEGVVRRAIVACRAMLPCSRGAMVVAKAWPTVLVVMSLSSPESAAAQEHFFNASGLHPNRGYMAGVPSEHIDVGTGSLVVTLTPLVLPGNAGGELRFIRSLNSKHADSA